jgi:hypothetical protein
MNLDVIWVHGQRPESCGNTEITVNGGNKKRILLVEA